MLGVNGVKPPPIVTGQTGLNPLIFLHACFQLVCILPTSCFLISDNCINESCGVWSCALPSSGSSAVDFCSSSLAASSLVLSPCSVLAPSNIVACFFGFRLGLGRLKPIGLCVMQRCHSLSHEHFHLLAEVFL